MAAGLTRPTTTTASPTRCSTGLIHRADLDGLVRLVDDCCATARLGRGCGACATRPATPSAPGASCGRRRRWPSTAWRCWRRRRGRPACSTRDRGRFSIGPLTEVVAQHHTWAELAPPARARAAAAFVAHERALRGEAIEPATTAALPDVLELPVRARGVGAGLRAGRPTPTTAASSRRPTPPGPLADVDAAGRRRRPRSTTTPSSSPCASSSRRGRRRRTGGPTSSPSRVTRPGRVRALGVAPGPLGAADAGRGRRLAGLGGRQRRRPRPAARCGRRPLRRAVAASPRSPTRSTTGRSPLDELGELAGELRWWWWDAHEPATGWQLQLAVEDPAEGLAWAISARDAS